MTNKDTRSVSAEEEFEINEKAFVVKIQAPLAIMGYENEEGIPLMIYDSSRKILSQELYPAEDVKEIMEGKYKIYRFVLIGEDKKLEIFQETTEEEFENYPYKHHEQ